jgi:hypothetical protein
MWLLQDTRQEELIALQTNLTSQQTELVNKTTSMGLEYKKLSDYQRTYTDSLRKISMNPEYKKAFEELTGINTTIAAQQAWLDYITFMHNNPVVGTKDGAIQPAAAVIPKSGLLGSMDGAIIPKELTTLSGLLGSLVGKVIPKLAEGTDYVPSTGVYQLHKGEAVIPAGQNSGGVTIGNISITIPVKTNASPQDIAKAVTIALDSQIMQYDSTGKLSSKYRRR